MPADFYEQMDRAGILVDAGFQCCDNWQREEGETEYTAHELKVLQPLGARRSASGCATTRAS